MQQFNSLVTNDHRRPATIINRQLVNVAGQVKEIKCNSITRVHLSYSKKSHGHDEAYINKLDVDSRDPRHSSSSPFTFVPKGSFEVVWTNVAVFVIGHLLHASSALFLLTADSAVPFKTAIYACILGLIAGLGITAGAHRLWSHRAYKAKLPLRIFLMICQCIAGQNSLYVWCRDHRAHHKFCETDADPHNTKRGFFFAHVGWLMHKKHPAVISAAKKLNFNDLLDDPVVRFQSDHYNLLYLLFALLIPCAIPVIFWDERPLVSFFFCYISRYVTSLHCTWFVNSTAHMFGNRPYDETIEPRENVFVSYGALGEGYHNYHHTYPSDYRTAEDGKLLNITKLFIDAMAKLHLAYELKVAPPAAALNNYQKHRKVNVPIASTFTDTRATA